MLGMENYSLKDCLYRYIKYALIWIGILQTSGLLSAECSLLTPPTQQILPGEAAVLIVNINNSTPKDILLPVDIQLPEFCEALVAFDKYIPLSPDSSHMLLLPISVAKGTPPGVRKIMLSIGSETFVTQLIIEGHKDIAFEASLMPSIAAEGQSFPISLKGLNTGNIPVPLQLEVIIDNDAYGYLECEQYVIQPGEDRVFEGQVHLLPSTCRARNRVVQILVTNAETCEELYTFCSVVDVLPCGFDESPDPWIKVPGHMRFFTAGEEGELIVGAELFGRGFVDEEQLREVDYEFLIPSKTHTTLYNQYQRLFVGIIDPQFEFVIGDTNYNLTPLTERWGFGRGVGIDFNFDRFSYGSFYRQLKQYHTCQIEEGAAYIEYAFQPYSHISLNFIRRSQIDTPQGNIVSVRCEDAPTPGRFLGLEFAYDTSTRGHHGDRKGYDIDLKNTFGTDSSWYFSRTYAGKGFYGYYNDSEYFSAGVDLGLSPITRLLVTTNRVCLNLNHCDTTAPRWRDYTAKLSYWYDPAAQITFVGTILTGKDVYNPCNFDFSQAWGGIQFAYNTGRYAFYCISEVGGQKDHVTNTICKPLQRYNFDFNMLVDEQRSFTLHYESGNTDPYDARKWRYAAGGAFVWRYKAASFAEVFARAINDRFYGDNINGKCYDGKYLHAMGRVSHTFNNLHNLGIRLDCFISRRQDSRDEYKFIAAYTIPTESPVKWRTDIGAIEGCIYDDLTQEPISNAVVSLGDEARLTDSQGCYRFSNLCPGIHELSTSLLPCRMETVESKNMPVNVIGGCTTTRQIAATYTGQLEGIIKVLDYEENINTSASLQSKWKGINLSLVERKGLANARIILSRNGTGEILSTTTGCLGNFKFENLHPGMWVLKIIPYQMPDEHYIENDTLEIYVQRNALEKIEIKVLPKAKEILPLMQLNNPNDPKLGPGNTSLI